MRRGSLSRTAEAERAGRARSACLGCPRSLLCASVTSMSCRGGWAGPLRRGRLHSAAGAPTRQAVRPSSRIDRERPGRLWVCAWHSAPRHLCASACSSQPGDRCCRFESIDRCVDADTACGGHRMPAFGQGGRSGCPVGRREQTECGRSDLVHECRLLPGPVDQGLQGRRTALPFNLTFATHRRDRGSTSRSIGRAAAACESGEPKHLTRSCHPPPRICRRKAIDHARAPCEMPMHSQERQGIQCCHPLHEPQRRIIGCAFQPRHAA